MDGMNGAVKAYIRRMLAECGAGMKALLLDAVTVRNARCVSLPCSSLACTLALVDGHREHGVLAD